MPTYVDPSWHDAQSFLGDLATVVNREQREELERILHQADQQNRTFTDGNMEHVVFILRQHEQLMCRFSNLFLGDGEEVAYFRDENGQTCVLGSYKDMESVVYDSRAPTTL